MLSFIQGYRPTNDELEELYELYGDSNVIDLDNLTLNYTDVRSMLAKNGKFRKAVLGTVNPLSGINHGSYIDDFMRSNVLTDAGESARTTFQSIVQKGNMSGSKIYNFIKAVNESDRSGIRFKESSGAFVREAIIRGFVSYENAGGRTSKERGALRATGKRVL